MPMPFVITAISGYYPDIAVTESINLFLRIFYIFIGIFYPSGEPISPHLLRCGLFVVRSEATWQSYANTAEAI